MLILFLLIAFLILIAAILLTQVVLITEFKDNSFFASVKILNFTVFDNKDKNRNKYDKKEKNGETTKEKKPDKFNLESLGKYTAVLKNLFTDINKMFGHFKKKVKANEFKVDVTFGMEDAAETGIATGIIWAFIGSVYPVVDTIIDVKDPVINVNPKFNCEYFKFEYKGIYKIRIYKVLYLAVKGLNLFKKYKKLMNINGGA